MVVSRKVPRKGLIYDGMCGDHGKAVLCWEKKKKDIIRNPVNHPHVIQGLVGGQELSFLVPYFYDVS